jgi:hypothetical protein
MKHLLRASEVLDVVVVWGSVGLMVVVWWVIGG